MEVVKNKEILETKDLTNKVVFKQSFYGSYYIYDYNYFDSIKKINFLNNIMKSYKDYNEVLTSNTPRKIYFDIDNKYNTEKELKENKIKFIQDFERDIKKYILHIDKNV